MYKLKKCIRTKLRMNIYKFKVNDCNTDVSLLILMFVIGDLDCADLGLNEGSYQFN